MIVSRSVDKKKEQMCTIVSKSKLGILSSEYHMVDKFVNNNDVAIAVCVTVVRLSRY